MPKKILLVKPSSLGDIIHTLPVLNAIKASGDFIVDWIVADGFESLLEGHPMIRYLWIIKKHRWKPPTGIFRFVKEVFSLSKKLRLQKYDIVIDLQGLFRSGIITAVSGANLRIGFKNARELSPIFYNKKILGSKKLHAVDRYLQLLSLINIKTDKIFFPMPSVSKENFISPPYYLIVPGARWKTKRWLPEYFAITIREINYLNKKIKPVIIGSYSDIMIAEKICKISKVKCINLTGKTNLKQLCQLISKANFMITNDSGPMHIAAAYKVKVFAIFGPTDEKLTGPYGQLDSVFSSNVQCRPCFKKKCEDLICMKKLKPEIIIKKIKNFINISDLKAYKPIFYNSKLLLE